MTIRRTLFPNQQTVQHAHRNMYQTTSKNYPMKNIVLKLPLTACQLKANDYHPAQKVISQAADNMSRYSQKFLHNHTPYAKSIYFLFSDNSHFIITLHKIRPTNLCKQMIYVLIWQHFCNCCIFYATKVMIFGISRKRFDTCGHVQALRLSETEVSFWNRL
jgi:hypothetical protein